MQNLTTGSCDLCKLKQNWKSDDSDAVAYTNCVVIVFVKAHKAHIVKLMLYKYKSWWHVHVHITERL